MCPIGCTILYDEKKSLEELTCPCGKGYWDVFQAAFVPGANVRAGTAPSRKAYEERCRAELTPEKYEAKIRHQYLIHFLDCGVKKILDKNVKPREYDGQALQRALNEVKELAEGNITSRGRSTATQSLQSGTNKSQGNARIRSPDFSLSRPTADSPPPSYGSPPLTTTSLDDNISALPFRSLSDTPSLSPDTGGRSPPRRDTQGTTARTARSISQTVSRHSGDDDQRGILSRRDSVDDATEERRPRQKVFLPERGIRFDVLEYHQRKSTFGDWEQVEKGQSKDGRSGFVITLRSNAQPLSKSDIQRIIEESQKVDQKVDAAKQRRRES